MTTLKGFTPLHYAVYEHHLDIIELLLQHGASCQANNKCGLCPSGYLHKAISKDCRDLCCRDIAAKLEG